MITHSDEEKIKDIDCYLNANPDVISKLLQIFTTLPVVSIAQGNSDFLKLFFFNAEKKVV